MMSFGKKTSEEIVALEREVLGKLNRIAELKRAEAPDPVDDHTLAGRDGPVRLSALFDGKPDLIVIHNMGESCSYCTLWADGFIGLTDHLRDRAGLALVTADPISTFGPFADGRGWRLPVVSAAGSTFTADLGFEHEGGALPGMSTLRRRDDGAIERIASAPFGPMDQFCALWQMLALLDGGAREWHPRFSYD